MVGAGVALLALTKLTANEEEVVALAVKRNEMRHQPLASCRATTLDWLPVRDEPTAPLDGWKLKPLLPPNVNCTHDPPVISFTKQDMPRTLPLEYANEADDWS